MSLKEFAGNDSVCIEGKSNNSFISSIHTLYQHIIPVVNKRLFSYNNTIQFRANGGI